jgi:hypothetical protein
MTSTRRKSLASPDQEKVEAYVKARVRKVLRKVDNDTQTSLRLPRAMYDALSKAADEHGLGMGEEIRERLETSFGEIATTQRDPRFADLLSALTHVAAGAVRMYPPHRVEYRNEIVEDISAHWVFEAATQLLLDAFRPAGILDGLPKDPTEARVEAMRRADRLVAAALGALGERGTAAFDRLSDVDQDDLIKSGFKREPGHNS